jgi:hypothetical protein
MRRRLLLPTLLVATAFVGSAAGASSGLAPVGSLHPSDAVATFDGRVVGPPSPTAVRVAGTFRVVGALVDSGQVSGVVRLVRGSWRYDATLRGAKSEYTVLVTAKLRRAKQLQGSGTGVIRGEATTGTYAGQRFSGPVYLMFALDQKFMRILTVTQVSR